MYFDKQREMGIRESDLKYPELDQISEADSSNYLSEHIKLKDGGAYITNILNYTKTDNIQSATIEINNKHRDLEVIILPLNEEALVNIEHRPTNITRKNNPKVRVDKNKQAIIPIFNKLATLYGINFHNVTIADLNRDPKFQEIVDAKHTNAFILNGEIYINTDVADIDAPIHELTHLFLGSIKTHNPQLYTELVSIAEKLPTYNELAKNYQNRTKSDLNEEIFVTELAKYVANRPSVIQKLPTYIQEEILYNVKRLLDSMLMGDISVKAIPISNLMSMSLYKIAELVNSDVFTNSSRTTLDDSSIHRILNNRKSDLMNNNELIEECQ